jgi:hypothetical protein
MEASMDESKQSVSIHFRANPDDRAAVEEIKETYGLTTNAAALRLAVRTMLMRQKAGEQSRRGNEGAGVPLPATAFWPTFDLFAAAKIEEGANDEQ